MNRWQKVGALGVAVAVLALGVGRVQAAIERRSAAGTARKAAPFGDGELSAGFVPIAPCRVFDTRVHHLPLVAGQIRQVHVVGPTESGTEYSSQGGTAAGCGIPVDATSFTFSVTAIDPTGSGYLRFVQGSGGAGATILSYPSHASPPATSRTPVA